MHYMTTRMGTLIYRNETYDEVLPEKLKKNTYVAEYKNRRFCNIKLKTSYESWEISPSIRLSSNRDRYKNDSLSTLIR